MYKDEIKKYRRKKNTILFVVLFSLVAIITSYFLALHFEWINKNLLDGILLIVLFVSIFLLAHLKDKITFYLYKYNLYLMLEEDLPPLKAHKSLFTNNWQDNFENDGFINHENNSRFAVYYQVPDSSSPYKDFGKVALIIVINNDPKLDIYGTTIQESIKGVYEQIEKKNKRIKREVVIHFKKYEKFNQNSKTEIQNVLVYKQDSFGIININVGYFSKTNEVYYLRPTKRYPNRLYYLSCKLIENYI